METTKVDDAIALKQKISNDSARITAEIRAEIGELETEYLKARKEQKRGVILLITLTFLSAHLLAFISNSTVMVLIFLGLFVYGFSYGFKLVFGKLGLVRKYNHSVNKIIFAKTFSLLGLDGRMVVTEEVDDLISRPMTTWQDFLKSMKPFESIDSITTLVDLENSELITESHNTNQVDNILEINYKNSIIRIAELDIEHSTGSGKNKQTKFIFHGYFAFFDLKKELSGRTFVTTEGDEQGFGNLPTFEITDSEVEETVLEWNEFENLLHVATTDGVEARYILTPDFMHDLYEWWQGRKTNIRLSFIGNRLYILYPDDKIRLNETVEKITDEAITEYIYTIAWPMQNVIKLIDDVRL